MVLLQCLGLAGISASVSPPTKCLPRFVIHFLPFYSELSGHGYRGLGIPAIGICYFGFYTGNKLSL